ncbi:hypothetical protein [Bacillus toyonensis]|uniref:hypothetical protein n=1 Tax=Bacillus toyonensis TaxID=155322 RepID=UPI002E1A35BE|nr:hypothetical protein [Bacillus toyonensis]
MKIDRYDIFYGISETTKEKIMYWLYSTVFSTILMCWIKEKNETFLQLSISLNPRLVASLILSIFILGLILYFIVLVVMSVLDLKHFKKIKGRYLIQTNVLNPSQKDRALKKIQMRKGLYSVVLSPHNVSSNKKLNGKQLEYYAKKLGTKKEITSKMRFLEIIEAKILQESHLKNSEVEYLNDLLFSSEDIKLFQRLQKDLKK